MKNTNWTQIRNRTFDIAHIILLGNFIGYWIGFKTAIIQYASMGIGAFLFFLAAGIIGGFFPSLAFERLQAYFKIGSFNWNDVFRTQSGVVLGLLFSLYYRESYMLNLYYWAFGISTLLYVGYCVYIIKKRKD